MKYRSIIFSSEMVRAILEKRKTQTRRVLMLPRWSTGLWEHFELEDGADENIPMTICQNTGCLAQIQCPYGKPGDRMWVKETWGIDPNDWFPNPSPWDINFMLNKIQYKADWGNEPYHWGWHPSIFMPRWASRLTLEIVNISLEHLQDISEEDAVAEGCHHNIGLVPAPMEPPEYDGISARQDYRELWDFLNAKRGHPWEANDWIWRIEFKVI